MRRIYMHIGLEHGVSPPGPMEYASGVTAAGGNFVRLKLDERIKTQCCIEQTGVPKITLPSQQSYSWDVYIRSTATPDKTHGSEHKVKIKYIYTYMYTALCFDATPQTAALHIYKLADESILIMAVCLAHTKNQVWSKKNTMCYRDIWDSTGHQRQPTPHTKGHESPSPRPQQVRYHDEQLCPGRTYSERIIPAALRGNHFSDRGHSI